MKKVIPSINNFPIFLHFGDLEYEEKKQTYQKLRVFVQLET